MEEGVGLGCREFLSFVRVYLGLGKGGLDK